MKVSGSEVLRRKSSDLSNPNDVALNGGLEKLGGIGHAHFLHHVGAMGFHGFYADFEPLTDFLILESSPYELQNFLFPAL